MITNAYGTQTWSIVLSIEKAVDNESITMCARSLLHSKSVLFLWKKTTKKSVTLADVTISDRTECSIDYDASDLQVIYETKLDGLSGEICQHLADSLSKVLGEQQEIIVKH